MSERDLSKAVTDWLRRQRARIFGYKNWGNKWQRKGLPDFVLCVPHTITQEEVGTKKGLFVGIELKTPAGKLRPEQIIVMQEILNAHGVFEVAYSIQQVRAVIDEILGLKEAPTE